MPRRPRPPWILPAALLTCALAALPATAQSLPPLPEAARADWPALGVVNGEGPGGPAACTGTLVAPALVLTAAHCAGAPGDDPARMFLPGGPDSTQPRRAVRTEWHPNYTQAPTALARYQYDLALITLEAPLALPPLPAALPTEPRDTLAIVGFHRHSPQTLNAAFDCPDQSADPSVSGQIHIRLGCPVVSGNSGAPALAQTPEGWRIVGVTVARARAGTATQALVAPLDGWVLDRIAAAQPPG